MGILVPCCDDTLCTPTRLLRGHSRYLDVPVLALGTDYTRYMSLCCKKRKNNTFKRNVTLLGGLSLSGLLFRKSLIINPKNSYFCL